MSRRTPSRFGFVTTSVCRSSGSTRARFFAAKSAASRAGSMRKICLSNNRVPMIPTMAVG